MPQYTIRIDTNELATVRQHALQENKKIQAIKHLRTHGKQYPPEIVNRRNEETGDMEEVENFKVGLRNAKHAVEVMMGTLDPGVSHAIVAPNLKIHSFKIETSDGMVEVDIDTLRIHLLDGMSSMDLSQMAHMAELARFIADWQMSPGTGESRNV